LFPFPDYPALLVLKEGPVAFSSNAPNFCFESDSVVPFFAGVSLQMANGVMILVARLRIQSWIYQHVSICALHLQIGCASDHWSLRLTIDFLDVISISKIVST